MRHRSPLIVLLSLIILFEQFFLLHSGRSLSGGDPDDVKQPQFILHGLFPLLLNGDLNAESFALWCDPFEVYLGDWRLGKWKALIARGDHAFRVSNRLEIADSEA